jgi:hypothetical protein
MNFSALSQTSDENPNHIIVTTDFGSSGSRVSVIEFGENFDNYHELYKYKLNIPLTVTAGNLDYAEKYARNLYSGIPAAIAATGIDPSAILSVQKGTAGMRTLAPSTQKEIYDVLEKTFAEMTNITNSAFGTITGSQEALYGWGASNYFVPNETIATIDFGGVSIEMTYPTITCNSSNVYNVSLNDINHCVYAISKPVGNDQGRNGNSNSNCFPKEYPGYYTITNTSCNQTANAYYTNSFLNPINIDNINNVPSIANKSFLLSTYVYTDCYLTEGKSACDWYSKPFNLQDYEQATVDNCQSTWTPELDGYAGTYCWAGYAGSEIFRVTQMGEIAAYPYIVDKVEYQANGTTYYASLSWTTGAALESWNYFKILSNTTNTALPSTPVIQTGQICREEQFSPVVYGLIGAASTVGALAVIYFCAKNIKPTVATIKNRFASMFYSNSTTNEVAVADEGMSNVVYNKYDQA